MAGMGKWLARVSVRGGLFDTAPNPLSLASLCAAGAHGAVGLCLLGIAGGSQLRRELVLCSHWGQSPVIMGRGWLCAVPEVPGQSACVVHSDPFLPAPEAVS